MFSMPTSRYWMSGKVNETLQTLYALITADINKMSTKGLSTNLGAPWLEVGSCFYLPQNNLYLRRVLN